MHGARSFQRVQWLLQMMTCKTTAPLIPCVCSDESFCYDFQLQPFWAKQRQWPQDQAQQSSQATSATNDSTSSLDELWGMRTMKLIKCDEVNGNVSQSNSTTCPAICRVKHTGKACCLQEMSDATASVWAAKILYLNYFCKSIGTC